MIRPRQLLPGLEDAEILQQLIERADSFFIRAATAIRFIKEGGPHMRCRLELIVT